MKNEAVPQSEFVNTLEGVPLIGLLPDSPAELAGMHLGDLIVAVNGMRTENAFDYVVAKRRRKSAMQVIFIRGGAYYEATMHWADASHSPSADAVAQGQATRLGDGGFVLPPPRVSRALS